MDDLADDDRHVDVLVLGRAYRIPAAVLGRYSDLADAASGGAVAIDLPERLELGDVSAPGAGVFEKVVEVLVQYDPADHRRYRFQRVEDVCAPMPLWAVAAAARALHCDEVADACDAASVRDEFAEFGLETFRFALRHGLDCLRRRSVLALVEADWELDVAVEHVADCFLHLDDDDTDLRPLLTSLVRRCCATAPQLGPAEFRHGLRTDPQFEIPFTDAAPVLFLRDVLLRASTAWPPDLVCHGNRLAQRFRIVAGTAADRYDAHRALFEIMAQVADQAVLLLPCNVDTD